MRDSIERVVLRPAPDGRGFAVELEGAIAAMTRLGMADGRPGFDEHRDMGDRVLFACSAKVVAGIGFEPMTFRL